jgi:hypothetical protein
MSSYIMRNITGCKKIDTAIRRAEKKLITEAKKNGLYENFGQREVGMIKDKFINISDYSSEMNSNRDKLNAFSNWCSSLSYSALRMY